MQITCTTTFLDGRDRFEKGDTRTVSDEDGARFIKNGWAVADGGEPHPLPDVAQVDLNTQSATHGQEANHG